MLTIYKYQLGLAAHQSIEAPIGAKWLDAQMQHNKITLWAIVDPELKMVKHHFEIVGTGHPIIFVTNDYMITHNYLATVQHEGFVWHVFYIGETV